MADLGADRLAPVVRTAAGVAGDVAWGGLADLALKGTRAATGTRAFGAAGAIGAGVTAVTGTLADVPALVRGELDVRAFSENRVIDLAEGGAGAVAGFWPSRSSAVSRRPRPCPPSRAPPPRSAPGSS